MARKIGKIGKKITLEIERIFKSEIKQRALGSFFNFWWVMRGSNPRPSRCKRDALAN